MILNFYLIIALTIIQSDSSNLNWTQHNRVTDAHLRGLSVVNDEVVWASGTKGTVIKTTNGGKKWSVFVIPDCEELDFRDIYAFDDQTAVVLSAGEIARFYRTDNDGTSWNLVYENTSKGIFFDGMDFRNEKEGIAYSDPIDGKWFLVKTEDGGKSWKKMDTSTLPDMLKGEAGYAASGTGLVYQDDHIWITGGSPEKARVFHSEDNGVTWSVADTPLQNGEGKGVFSMVFIDENNGVAVGGSYVDSENKNGNCATTSDGGKTWQLVETNQPAGYRSCVAVHLNKNLLISVGRNGADYSHDLGKTWTFISPDAYYTCKFGKNKLWATGKGGKIGVIDL